MALRTADQLRILSKNAPIRLALRNLVLSGALAQAFKSDGVTFDQQHGAFNMNTDLMGILPCKATGLHALWARKALEREGFAVKTTQNGSRIQVKIHGEYEALRWRLQIQDQFSDHATIYELLSALRKTVKPR